MTSNNKIENWYSVTPIASGGSTFVNFLIDDRKYDIKITSDIDSFERIYLKNLCMRFPCIGKDNIIEIYDKPMKSNIKTFICEDDDVTKLNIFFFEIMFKSMLELEVCIGNGKGKKESTIQFLLYDLKYDMTLLSNGKLLNKMYKKCKVTLDIEKKHRVYVKTCLSFLRKELLKMIKDTTIGKDISILNESMTNENINYKELLKSNKGSCVNILFMDMFMTSADKELSVTMRTYNTRMKQLVKENIISMHTQEKEDTLLLKTLINRTTSFIHFLKMLMNNKRLYHSCDDFTIYYAVRYTKKTIVFLFDKLVINKIFENSKLKNNIINFDTEIIGTQWKLKEKDELLEMRNLERPKIKELVEDFKELFAYKIYTFDKKTESYNIE